MKPTALFVIGLAPWAACAMEDLGAADQAIDSAAEEGTLDGYTGRTFDADRLPPQLVTGDLVRHGGVAALVPDRGESVYAEGFSHGPGGEELEIEVDDDGTVRVGTEATKATAATTATPSDAAAAGYGACEDQHHVVGNFTWNTTLHYTFNAGSTPAYLPITFAEQAIIAGGENIVTAHNNCGRGDHVSATIHYDGRSSRGVNVTRDRVCGKRDGHSAVAFGDIEPAGDQDFWGYTCVWKRKQYIGGSGATIRFGVESDIRLEKGGDNWWQGEFCTGFGFNYVDLESVMTHERGHSFGLEHVDTSYNLTMYPFGEYCDKSSRTLGLGDLIGLEILY